MEQLSYQTLDRLDYDGYLLHEAPERVLQFGAGNFLRGFVEDFIDRINETAGFCGKVVIALPIPTGPADQINAQGGLYTLLLRGSEEGKPVSRRRVISCVSRCIKTYEDYPALLDCAKNPALRFLVSNTTEAGIVYDGSCRFDDTPPASFPAKLTRFLYERYTLGLPGFLILSCELIDHNGDELKRCVLKHVEQWDLPAAFTDWVEHENRFCSTLVDRIVTGYPHDEAETLWKQLGYEDHLLDTAEVFGAWVIEGPPSLREELPFERVGLPILVTDDCTLYKQRKVRILNGAHTTMVLGAYLAGQNIVRGCMEDEVIRGFLNRTVESEIIPTLDLPRRELTEFAAAVFERFQNPYIDHRLLDIALNSTAKWKARVMPSLLEYVKRKGEVPPCLTFSFAAYLCFYHGGRERSQNGLLGRRGGETYEIRDDPWILDFYYDHRNDDSLALARAVIGNRQMWDGALLELPNFEEKVAAALERIQTVGMYQALRECLESSTSPNQT